MDYDLRVTKAFATYRVGDRITDPSTIATVENLYASYVERVDKTPAPPDPAGPAVQGSDRLTLRRDGKERTVLASDLADFLGTPAPSNGIVAALIFS